MRTWFKRLATTCAIVAVSASAMLPGAHAADPATAAAPATTDANPALWVVKDEDTTIYLFGTVHVLKPGLGWFDEAVKTAFDKSDKLMLEMVMPEDQAAMAKEMMPLAIDQSGKTLSSRLDPEQLRAYQAALASLGIAPAQFDMFEPWFPAMTLSVLPLTKLGYDPEQGVEKLLTSSAKKTGKPVAGLETLSQQLGFFDTLPESQQISFLNSVVKDLDKLGPQLDKMVAQWAQGDPDALAVTMNDSLAETPELAQILLWDRNARWADQLKARMGQPGTVFVAVGAGHLAGNKSVQDYLKARGLVVTRVEY